MSRTGRETAYALVRIGQDSTMTERCVLCRNEPLPPIFAVATTVDEKLRILCERCITISANLLTDAQP